MNVGITLFGIFITVSVYILSLFLTRKYPSPFTMPVFFCTVTIILILSVSKISYEQYHVAKDIMSYLLGPATVALAVPLYKQRKIIYKNLRSILIGIFLGTIVTIVSAVYMAKIFGLSDVMIRSFSIKSITIPIASEVTEIINADLSLVTMFVMITGMFGAMFGTWILNIARITDPLARGLGFGTIAHGIGTSQAIKEGEVEGATSSVAIGLTGIVTSLIIPLLLSLLLI